MMPPPFLPLHDLFRTQRRCSVCCACCSCPGDSASRDQAPCCHSDHKVWGLRGNAVVYERMALFATRGCCLLASMPLLLRRRHLRPFPCQTTSRFIPTPDILCRFSGSEHKDRSSLKSPCGTEDASRGGFLFLFIIPSGGGGIPSQ